MNLGCGPHPAAGWVNVDRDEYRGAFFCDLLDTPLPFADETCEGAVAHHVLQMVPWPSLERWLAEVRRVLQPGAWLRITVPDLLGAVTAHDEGRSSWFPIDDQIERSIGGKLCVYLTQAGATRSVFTLGWLCELCERAGFTMVHGSTYAIERKVKTCGPEWLTALDSRLDESIVVEAQR